MSTDGIRGVLARAFKNIDGVHRKEGGCNRLEGNALKTISAIMEAKC